MQVSPNGLLLIRVRYGIIIVQVQCAGCDRKVPIFQVLMRLKLTTYKNCSGKNMKFKNLSLALAFALSAGGALAQTHAFDYSFSLVDGSVVSGEFSGIATGNTISNLSNASAFLDGISIFGSGPVTIDAFNAGNATVSFDGMANNFYFHQVSGGDYVIGANVGYSGVCDGRIGCNHLESAKWSVTQVATVPEPETYAMLLAGLGLIGAAVKRRKAKQG